MDLEYLMSGIGVVIDDKIEDTALDGDDNNGNADPIIQIVKRIEQEWNLPFYKIDGMPQQEVWSNLLQAASFIVLDWKLWPSGASHLEKAGIKKNIQFLEQAKDYFVPVFIFTNESQKDVESELPNVIYPEESPEKSFVFIKEKTSLLSGSSVDFKLIENWLKQNAAVYALKTWEQAFYTAKQDLFSSMYKKTPDWPRVFWKAYIKDNVDPSSSLTNLINDSLRGRMETSSFETKILAVPPSKVPKDDLQALISETSFRPQKTLPKNEIRCGDLFKQPKRKFLLNLRPDCDCIPRSGKVDEVELYCIEGKTIRDSELRKKFHNGQFLEQVWESIAFSINDGKSIQFDFRKLRVEKFEEIKDQRIGRLLHPYMTKIQQRYALYLQRQGLPRIPEAAVQ